MTKMFSPRLVLSASKVVSGLVDFCIGFVVMCVVVGIYGNPQGAAPLMFPALLLLTVLTVLGVGLWMSALNALYLDVRYVVPFLIQFWMFASPVAYPASLVPAHSRWIYGLNPMAGVNDGFRWLRHRTRPAARPAAPRFCRRRRRPDLNRGTLLPAHGRRRCRPRLIYSVYPAGDLLIKNAPGPPAVCT